MKKTFVMFFLLGLMVSCASQERSVSSVDGEQVVEEHEQHRYEPRSSYR